MNHHRPAEFLSHKLSAFPARAYGKFAGWCGVGRSVHVGEIPSRQKNAHSCRLTVFFFFFSSHMLSIIVCKLETPSTRV